jgi:hypothetical protein
MPPFLPSPPARPLNLSTNTPNHVNRVTNLFFAIHDKTPFEVKRLCAGPQVSPADTTSGENQMFIPCIAASESKSFKKPTRGFLDAFTPSERSSKIQNYFQMAQKPEKAGTKSFSKGAIMAAIRASQLNVWR